MNSPELGSVPPAGMQSPCPYQISFLKGHKNAYLTSIYPADGSKTATIPAKESHLN